MSIVPKNKKFLELEGVRVYLNRKDNTIQIISTDDDLTGKPFQITLNQGTPSEVSLRELLVEQGVAIEADDPFYGVPKYAPYENVDNSDPMVIPIGVGMNNVGFSIDLSISPHILINGGSGSGKSVAQRNILLHTAGDSNWETTVFDSSQVEFTYLSRFVGKSLRIISPIDELVDFLEDISTEIDCRYSIMGDEGVNNWNSYTKFNSEASKNHLILLDGFSEILYQCDEDQKASIQNVIGKITKLGRASGVHLVLSSQMVPAIPTETMKNISTRIIVGPAGDNLSNELIGRDAIDVGSIRGRAVVSTYGEVTGIQLYYSTTDMFLNRV